VVGVPRRAPPVDLVLDKRSTLPLYLQLKHHLIHLVSSGVWQPGMAIPSVRQLAADLGLATATVQRAYGELQDLGVLVGQAGRGVFVADLANGMPEIPGERRGVLHGLLARSVSHALSLGFTQGEIVATVQQLITGRDGAGGPPRVVFVGSSADAADKYRQLLADALADLPVHVAGVTIADVRDDPDGLLDRLEPVRCLVGLVRTFTEVRRLVAHRGTPVFGLVVDLTPETVRRIRETPPDEPIGVVAQEAYLTSARTIVRQHRAGAAGPDAEILWAESRNRRAVQRVVERCPTIVHTFGVTKLLERLAPGRRLIELEYLPTAASIDQLRAVAAPEPLALAGGG
jgi:GntR family transcriptional regulator